MASHSNILAWEIPWTEEAGGLMWSQGVGHDLVTKQQSAIKYQGLDLNPGLLNSKSWILSILLRT